MKVLIKTESGRTRSLNRIIAIILAIVAFCATVKLAGDCFDAEMRHNDLVVQNFLNNRK